MKLKQLICLLLAAVVLGACGSPAGPTEATEETKPTDAWLDPVVPTDAAESLGKPEPVEDLTVPDQTTAVGGANFALDLLRGAAKPDATTILSPYSALLALGMAANGAGGRTLEEMEYALGARLEDLNAWLASCRAAEDGEVVSANSIWTRNGTVQLLRSSGRPWSRNTARRSMPGTSVLRPSTNGSILTQRGASKSSWSRTTRAS